jgi:hypothetical protein
MGVEMAEDMDFEDQLLAELEGLDFDDETEEELQEEVETKFSKKDEKMVGAVKKTKEILSKHIEEEKSEKMINEFMTSASDNTKFAFNVLLRGDETPAQLKKVMEAATQKGLALDEKENPPAPTEDEVDKKAEEKAEKIAKDAYGVGPIQSGRPPDEREELLDRVAKGDTRAALELLMDAPETTRADIFRR